MFLPFFFQAVLQNSSTIFETEFGPALYKLCVSIYYLALITFFFRAWLDYYLDIWVITDERIVNIEQKGLFSREISTQQLYRIQDVTALKSKALLPLFSILAMSMCRQLAKNRDLFLNKFQIRIMLLKKLWNWWIGRKKSWAICKFFPESVGSK